MTGDPHRLFWMRSAWWCADCRQKVESCCEGGGCPSVAEALPAPAPLAQEIHSASSGSVSNTAAAPAS